VAALVLVGRDPAEGKLEPSTLSDLLRESNLIIEGRVIRASLDEGGKEGEAVLRIQHVYVGDYRRETISIRWSGAEHDQRISDIGESRLLFLKKVSEGSYTGAQYGRSYWPITYEMESRRAVTIYVYPMTHIDIDIPGVLKEASVFFPDLPSKQNPVTVPVVFIDDILRLLPGNDSKARP